MKLALVAAVAAAALVTPALADNASSLKIVDHFKVGGEGGWDVVSFDPTHRVVYLTRGTRAIGVDADKGAAVFEGPAAKGHTALPVNGGEDVLVTNAGDNTATILSAKDGKVKASIATAADPDVAALDPVSGLAYVMGAKAGAITLVDTKAAKAVGEIKVGGSLEFIAFDGQGRGYLNIEDRNELVVIDTKAKTVLAHRPLKDCDGPTGVAYVPGADVTISACANGVAKVLKAKTGAEVATLKIGTRPDTALYNPATGYAYIPTGGDGALWVIGFDGDKSAKVVDVIATAKGARTATLDPKTGRIFLPSASFNPPAEPGKRPTMVPGSFEILVVGK
jgi:DNA-binding beta-propeller fold protein YncE